MDSRELYIMLRFMALWRNGKRSELKPRRAKAPEGSNPSKATMLYNNIMEKQKPEQANWHINARIHLSKLATLMCTEFTRGADVQQTDQYNDLYEQYMQLQTDIAWHDYCDGGLQKSRFISG